ncbi:cysteine hydrolase family protein [Rubellimicrobium sp. CFH 75288]|uniref:cysteine hydrolase family protein n=1 Tax=Rubellimicrobium sp. CFH 75288 TaxID=2697034 RepID=UPI0014122F54|nr:isochorismatase family cysteine hydrolase [Rubellimicrobium sp. CFH 75288]NAZ37967.1 isochorismatase family protein [Rubellimicrobium sp. CFH 75288]
MHALIVIDMLNDFYTGVLANEAHASRIVPAIRRLIDHARGREDWLVVYSNDAHRHDDPEIAIWGPHAMAGTPGAQVIDALAPVGAPREIVSPKRFYGAFDGTDLGEVFARYGVTDVVLTGQHTHCCVRHTCYGAMLRGLRAHVPTDAVCVFEGVDQEAALEYLRTIYGARITNVDTLIGEARAAA